MRCQRSAARINVANTSFTRLCSVKQRVEILTRTVGRRGELGPVALEQRLGRLRAGGRRAMAE